MTRFALVKTSGTVSEEERFTAASTGANGRLNYSTKVPPVDAGSYVSYRIYGIDGSNNKGRSSNTMTVMGPLPPVGLSATAWGLIGAGIVLAVILITIFLVWYLCPDKARARKRQATKRVREILEMPAKQSSNESSGAGQRRDDHHEWRTVESLAVQSSAQRAGQRPKSTSSSITASASVQGSERIYFGQRDIDEMTSGRRSDNGSFDG